MAKKQAAYEEITVDVSPADAYTLMQQIMNQGQDEVDEDYDILRTCHLKRLQKLKVISEQTKQKRALRMEARRREEELKRLAERREGDLDACAIAIQKLFRSYPIRSKFRKLKESMGELNKKKALIVAVDQTEDRRVRLRPFACDDAMELARVLQTLGFAVRLLADSCPDAADKPTKNNIQKAIAEATESDPDATVWIHLCCVGGKAPVSGFNPYRHAQREASQKQTPRTRMMTALRNNNASQSKAGGDVIKFLFPGDAKSSRLSYESIIMLDECTDLIRRPVDPLNNQWSQRILTVDTTAIGAVDGAEGGAFGFFGSTTTQSLFVEYPLAEASPKKDDIGALLEGGQGNTGTEFHRMCLTSLLLDSLKCGGAAWGVTPEQSPILTTRSLLNDLEQSFRRLQLPYELSGNAWGQLTIAAGEKCIVPLKGMSLWSSSAAEWLRALQSGALNGALNDSGLAVATNSATAAVYDTGMRWRKEGRTSSSRQCTAEIKIHVDLTEKFNKKLNLTHTPTTVNPNTGAGLMIAGGFTLDAATELLHHVCALGCINTAAAAVAAPVINQTQMSPSFNQSMANATGFGFGTTMRGMNATTTGAGQAKPTVNLLRMNPARVVHIGLNGTFADVSKSRAAGKGEAGLWVEVVEALTGLPAQEVHYGVLLGRVDEGGVVLWIEAASQEETNSIVARLSIIPNLLSGMTVKTCKAELTMVMSMPAQYFERLVATSKGTYMATNDPSSPFYVVSESMRELLRDQDEQARAAEEKVDEEQLMSATLNRAGSLRGNEMLDRSQVMNQTISMQHQTANSTVNNQTVLNMSNISAGIDSGPVSPSQAKEEKPNGGAAYGLVAAAFTLAKNKLTTGAGGVAKSKTKLALLDTFLETEGMHVRGSFMLHSVRQLCTRVNDFDDSYLDILSRRDRVLMQPLLFTHASTILCVAVVAPTPDIKAKQCVEMARVARGYDPLRGFKFLTWDLQEPVKPHSTSGGAEHTVVTRERLVALLEAIKVNIQPPNLIIIDLAKKRSYKARLLAHSLGVNFSGSSLAPSPAPTTSSMISTAPLSPDLQFFPSTQIVAFCEEYLKGSLGDLLPPVKGCKVYGAGMTNTKYTLIPM